MLHRLERGFTLIEALIGLLLLGMVLGAVAVLFVQGARTATGSRHLTEGTRLAGRILEPIRAWPYTALYTSFGRTAADTGFEVDSLTNPRAQLWQTEIDSMGLPRARARIRIDPLGGPTFGESKGVRIVVTIEWRAGSEASAVRAATLAAVRF